MKQTKQFISVKKHKTQITMLYCDAFIYGFKYLINTNNFSIDKFKLEHFRKFIKVEFKSKKPTLNSFFFS